MSVSIAENVKDNIDKNEEDKVNSFKDNPGFGGQQIRVKIDHQTQSVAHVTFGKGTHHVSIFYKRDGEDFQIVGVGQHKGKKDGKTIYTSLWEGRDSRRVQVMVL